MWEGSQGLGERELALLHGDAEEPARAGARGHRVELLEDVADAGLVRALLAAGPPLGALALGDLPRPVGLLRNKKRSIKTERADQNVGDETKSNKTNLN